MLSLLPASIPTGLLLAANPVQGAFFVILVLIGAYKCFQISKRPTTSTSCTRGLGLVLLSFFLFWIAQSLGNNLEQYLVRELFRWLGIAAFLTGAVAAVVGLVSYKRADPPYRQGRAQAIWAIVIVSGFVILGIALYKDDWMAHQRAETKPQVHEEFNLSYGPPPAGWNRFDVKKINDEALFAYRHRSPEMYFMLIAESDVYATGMDTDMIASVAKSLVASIDDRAKVEDGPDIYIGDVVFKTFDSKAKVSGRAFAYHHAVTSHHGYAYQLVTFGKASIADEVHTAGQLLARQFHLIDPKRMDLGEGGTRITTQRSPEFGYAVDLSRGDWFTDPSLRKDLPSTAFHASLDGQARLLVLPIVLGDNEPPLEASLQSLLSMQGIEYPKHPLQNRITVDSEAKHELTFWYVTEGQTGEVLANCRVVQQNGLIYLIAGFRKSGDTAKKDLIESTVRNVRLFTPVAVPSLHAMTPEDKEVEALFFNEVGNHFYAQKAYGKARDYFLVASSLQPDNTEVMDNVTACFWELEEYEQALKYLNQQAPHIQDHQGLLGERAWLLAWAEQDYESMKLYARLFEAGFDDQDHLPTYLSLLEDHERIDEGLRLIAKFRSQGDSPLLQARQARFLMAAKRPKEAISFLTALPQPLHATPRAVLVSAYEADGNLAQALREQAGLIEAGYQNATAFHTKARIEKQLGKLEDASKTVHMGLLHFPKDEDLRGLSAEIDKLLDKD